MKGKISLAISVASLAALLAVPAAHATDVASRPLKASVLAKPNLIFGVDDSGSMDAELILETNDGALWWDYNAKSGWAADGTLHFNAAGDANTQWRKMIYLFPNGTGTGNRKYSSDTINHFAIPPTAAFAFVRSSDYNPLYYDSTVTYAPWSPAYVGGAVTSYSHASPTAAKSNPGYGTGTFNVQDTFSATTAENWTFTALPGMLLPGTAKVCEGTTCDPWPEVSTLGWTTSGGEYVVPASKMYNVSMDYFPATFYEKETCTVDGSACVSAPDGSTLKRYEIKSGNMFPSERSYADEIQNFANWWQYYRKRKLMLNAAMGQVLETLSGLRMGVMHFNNRPASDTRVTMYDADDTDSSANGLKVAGTLYTRDWAGGTPTREALLRIGQEYSHADGPIQYACQRNNAFILTDGFANASTPTVPTYDATTWGSGTPYETTYGNSLADIALAYYTLNPKSSLTTGKVPKTDADLNTNLHMNTYGLSLGAQGLLYTGDDSVPPAAVDAWTAPTAYRHPSAVDDLWHATLNARGQMYLASTPTETATQIQAGLTDILSNPGAQGGVAVSTVNLSRGDSRVYVGTYNPAGWIGDVVAYAIDASTGEVSSDEAWLAGEQLLARNWTERVIASYDGSAGVGFTTAAVGATVNPADIYGDTDAVINYLRGDRSNEGTLFRTRSSLIGAVINSEPAVSRADKVVYVQSGEGMLHAIDTDPATGGKELWAFVPRSVLASIGETVQRGYAFSTKLDGSPTLGGIVGGKTLLVAGTGASGRSFHALDVTSPRSLTETGLAAKVRWEFPSTSDAATQAKVGQALGRPQIVKLGNGNSGVLVTSGYNNDDGRGRLWLLELDTAGAISATYEFDTGAGSDSVDAGLAQVSGYLEDDGSVRYAYGGDLLGNVWRFDLQDKGTPVKVATLLNDADQAQPVTTAPELVEIDSQRIVVVGTGRLLDITDFGNSQIQTMYAIADGTTLTDARHSLVEQVYSNSTTITSNPVDWDTARGWYVDLPAGEQANTRPTVAHGVLAFVTNSNGATDCSASSTLYKLNLLTGGAIEGDETVSLVVSSTENGSAVNVVITNDGKARGLIQDGGGEIDDPPITEGGSIQPAKNSWREIRRK